MHKFVVICVLIAFCALQTSAKPIQDESIEVTPEPVTESIDVEEASTDAPATDAPVQEKTEEFVELGPEWMDQEVYVALPEHERFVRHIGIGGIGGGFVGGFTGGEIISPAYSVSSIQTVPVVASVPVVSSIPVVSTISTYPTYTTGYGYGGYSPVGFGGFGVGKFRSSYSVKGFGLGGGFIG